MSGGETKEGSGSNGSRRSAPAVPDRDLRRWQLVDLSETFNASVSEVLGRVAAAARPLRRPAFAATFGYWQHYLTRRYHSGIGADRVCDAAWRRKVGPDGIAWTTDGIPFRTARSFCPLRGLAPLYECTNSIGRIILLQWA